MDACIPLDDPQYPPHEPVPWKRREVISDLSAGAAGEHLVCADLLLEGYRAFMADQNCPYDVAVDIGSRLIRIQVKATREARSLPQRKSVLPAYMWFVRKAGKEGRRMYGQDDFDMLALVALDCRRIAYMPPSRHLQTIHIRANEDGGAPPSGGKSGKTFVQFPFKLALQAALDA